MSKTINMFNARSSCSDMTGGLDCLIMGGSGYIKNKQKNHWKILWEKTVSNDSKLSTDLSLIKALSQVRIYRPSPSVLLPFSWKMRSVLNRIINKFSDFYFSSYRENSLKIGSFYYKNDHNSKNQNRKYDFSFDQHIPHL